MPRPPVRGSRLRLAVFALALTCLISACGCASALAAKSRPSRPAASRSPQPVSIPVREFEESALVAAGNEFDAQVAAGQSEIWLQIDSFGGSIFDGMSFIKRVENAKKLHPRLRVKCAVDVSAYSMGFALLQSPACDERMMTKRSTLLAHNASGGTRGTADEMEEDAQMVRELSKALAEMCASRLNISVDAYRSKIDRHAWTFGWEEAIVVGAVDRVVDPGEIPPTVELQIAADPFGLGL